MGEKEFWKNIIYIRNSYVYIWYLVTSWACEVTEILKQRSTEEASFVWGLEWPHKPN